MKRWLWLVLGLLIIIIFLLWFVKDVNAFELPKEPALYFITNDSVLWLIKENKVQRIPLLEIDKEYLLKQFEKSSSLKIAGDYMGLAGGAIITAGEIASLTIPPLAPFIQLGTRSLGGFLALLGGIFRFTSKDLKPILLPAKLILLYQTQEEIEIKNFPRIIIVAQAPFSLIHAQKLILDGYLLAYNKNSPIGGLKIKWIKLNSEETQIKVVSVDGLGIYFFQIRDYLPYAILENGN